MIGVLVEEGEGAVAVVDLREGEVGVVQVGGTQATRAGDGFGQAVGVAHGGGEAGGRGLVAVLAVAAEVVRGGDALRVTLGGHPGQGIVAVGLLEGLPEVVGGRVVGEFEQGELAAQRPGHALIFVAFGHHPRAGGAGVVEAPGLDELAQGVVGASLVGEIGGGVGPLLPGLAGGGLLDPPTTLLFQRVATVAFLKFPDIGLLSSFQ